MTSVLLVGCGNMGFAMMTGWLSGSDAPTVWVVEPAEALAQRAADAGANAVAAAADLPADLSPDLVVLAVKPQMMGAVAPDYARFAKDAAFLSVAAGTTIAALQASLGPAAIIRCMPNTPAAIGQGMLVCCGNPKVSAAARALSTRLLTASGKVAWVDDESLMDAVTAISGSGPAYIFHFIECMTAAAQELGLPEDLSSQLAMQTVMGAGAYAAESPTPPDVLRQQVTSPGGTTAAALDVLMADAGLQALLNRATEAARDRGVELGKL